MFEHIENLQLISALRRASKPVTVVESRKTHSFFIRVKGSVMLDLYDRKLLVKEGELVFLPKGSSYTATALSEECIYAAMHFEGGFAQPPQAGCYSLEDFPEAEFIGACISDLWNFGTQADKYQCLSLFYSLLSYLSAGEHTVHTQEDRYKTLDPALAYLKTHIYDCDLRIGKLHRFCGISDTYFRKLFEGRFGVSPHSYVLAKRIQHAKAIITSGDFHTMEEVALAVGFQDPLYFSKVFKKACGVSPSAYAKL